MALRMGQLYSPDSLPDPLVYLERFGAFGGQAEQGHLARVLAHLLRALWMDDLESAKDLGALSFAAVEQAAMDQGRWDVAFPLTLVPEPPPVLLERRHARSLAGGHMAFSPLWEQEWTTVLIKRQGRGGGGKGGQEEQGI